tara:strand:- start:94 stop:597 length:504 start_codon:yes stop_codon:yes gene_type:complete
MNNRRTPPRRGRTLRKLSSLSDKLISSALRKSGFSLSKIILHWPQIAGPVADWSLPVYLNFPRGTTAKGTLTLSIKSGRGPEAISKSASLCDAINARYGYQAVVRIKVRQDLGDKRLTSTQKATNELSSENRQNAAFDADTLAKMTTKIKSPSVRASLIELGKAFKK